MAGAQRGIVGAAALMLALTACGGGGGDWADEDGRPLTLDGNGMLMALPGKLSAPEGWKGRDPEALTGERALDACQDVTASNCAGLAAAGGGRFSRDGESDQRIKYSVFAFDTVDNASVAMKGTLAEDRGDAGTVRELKVDTGAEAAEAFADTDGDAEVVMRAGAVVIRMQGYEVADEKTLGSFARLQVERVRAAANGQNPDA
ncbi:hypothetical protein [Streptomyces fradiae]|uniref:hypothetical protein n=1 Tax=Streptomyces fradiae TaxID=1906 RepID=UPI002942CA00|nr:hypothetical protein [Streptomyces fradiae]WOI61578.1 hypothetical protein RYQ63_17640 [Streptomyces fradiae]